MRATGLRVREIQTTTDAEGKQSPALDGEGREIEVWGVDVPQEIEAFDGTPAERQAAIDAYVAQERAKLQS